MSFYLMSNKNTESFCHKNEKKRESSFQAERLISLSGKDNSNPNSLRVHRTIELSVTFYVGSSVRQNRVTRLLEEKKGGHLRSYCFNAFATQSTSTCSDPLLETLYARICVKE